MDINPNNPKAEKFYNLVKGKPKTVAALMPVQDMPTQDTSLTNKMSRYVPVNSTPIKMVDLQNQSLIGPSLTFSAPAAPGVVASAVDLNSNYIIGNLTANNIAAGTITAAQIAAGTITGNLIAANTITASNIAAATITTNEIAANTITANNIAAATITSTQIAASTITAGNIASGTITTTQIAANTITGSNIAASTITGTNIAGTTITAGNIVSGTITTTQIASNTITGGNIAAGTITASNITSGTITGTQIAASTITGSNIAATTIAAGNIVSGTITTTQIAANTITGSNIAGTTITAGNIVSGTITTTQIAANTITGSNIAASTITGSNIAGTTITAGNIVSGTITTTQIAANTITGSNIAAGTITASNITSGTITGTQIAASTITGSNIAATTIAAGNIVSGTITATQIASATITGANIAATTIAAGNIVSGTITATQIASATITGSNIAATTIAAGNIVSGTITTTQIASNTITASNIAAATITGAKIAASTITASNLSVTSLSTITANVGTLTVNTGGSISSGMTGYNTNPPGYWLGTTAGGSPQFSIADANGNYFSFDGSNSANVLNISSTGIVGVLSSKQTDDQGWSKTSIWGSITQTPTTLAGYGITNGQTTLPNALGNGYVLQRDLSGSPYFAQKFDKTFDVYGDTLTNTQVTSSTNVVWGAKYVACPNPGSSVSILAWVNGYITNDSANANVAVCNLQYSTDGGATWSNQLNNVINLPAVNGYAATVSSNLGINNVTPTGDIMVRCQVKQQTTSANLMTFTNGRVALMVLPNNVGYSVAVAGAVTSTVPGTAAMNCTTVYPTTSCTASTTVTCTPGGGTPPYSYLWTKVSGTGSITAGSTSQIATISDTETTASPANTFNTVVNCKVTDSATPTPGTATSANCTVTGTYTLTYNPITASATGYDGYCSVGTNCANSCTASGSCTANATGGNGSYTYSWSKTSGNGTITAGTTSKTCTVAYTHASTAGGYSTTGTFTCAVNDSRSTGSVNAACTVNFSFDCAV